MALNSGWPLEHLLDHAGLLLERRAVGAASRRSACCLRTGGPSGLMPVVAPGSDAGRALELEDARVAEVAGDAGLDRLALPDDPHDEEEGHHRGDEVGVGHLPGAAVVAVPVALLLLDDDDRSVLHGALRHAACAWPSAAPRPWCPCRTARSRRSSDALRAAARGARTPPRSPAGTPCRRPAGRS